MENLLLSPEQAIGKTVERAVYLHAGMGYHFVVFKYTDGTRLIISSNHNAVWNSQWNLEISSKLMSQANGIFTPEEIQKQTNREERDEIEKKEYELDRKRRQLEELKRELNVH